MATIRPWLPVVVIGALTLIFFARLLLLGQVYLPADILNHWYPWHYYAGDVRPHNILHSDVIALYYPQDLFIASQLRQGALPLWDPLLLGGHPSLANGLSAVLYPTRLLFLALLPADLAHNLDAMLHLFLAGCFSVLFLRQLGVGRLGSLVGAIAWMFNGYVMVWLGFEHTVKIAALLPLALLLFEKAVSRRSVGWALGVGLVIALSLTSGNVQRSLYLLMALTGYAAFKLLLDLLANRSMARLLRPSLYYAVAVATGFALVACTILPTLELIDQSQRTTVPLATMFPQVGLRLALLGTFIIPGLAGGPTYPFELYGMAYTNPNEFQGYAGVLPLILAIAGLASRRAFAFFFGAMAIVALLLVLGTPLYNLLYYFVPGFDRLVPSRMLILYAFGIAMLAGFGADYLAGPAGPRLAARLQRTLAAVIALGALALVALNVVLRLYKDQFMSAYREYTLTHDYGAQLGPETLDEYYRQFDQIYDQFAAQVDFLSPAILVPLALALSCLVVLWAQQYRPRLFPALCVAVVALDLVYFGWTYNTVVDRGQIYPATPAVEYLSADEQLYRVALDTGARELFPNTMQPFGIQEVGGYQSLYPQRYAELLYAAENGKPGGLFGNHARLTRFDSAVIDLLNVKYVLRPPGSPTPAEGFNLVYDHDLAIYENEQVLPRAFIARECFAATDPQSALATMLAPGFDPRATVVLEGDSTESGICAQEMADGRAEVVGYSAERVDITASTSTGGWLVLSDTYYPGWLATVDDVPAAVHRVDYALRGILLPPGDHTVTFTYAPSSFYTGAAVSGFAAVVVAGAFVLLGWRRWRGRRAAQRLTSSLDSGS